MYSVVFYTTSLVLSCVLSTHNKRILYCIVFYYVFLVMWLYWTFNYLIFFVVVKFLKVLIALLIVNLPSPIIIIASLYGWYSGKKPLLATRTSSSQDIQHVNWSAACCPRYTPPHDHSYCHRDTRPATVHACWGQFYVSFVQWKQSYLTWVSALWLRFLLFVILACWHNSRYCVWL